MSKNLASWYFVTAYLFTEPEVKHVSEGLHWELLSTARVQQSWFTFLPNNVDVRRLVGLLLWQLPEKREDIKDSVQSPCRTELFWYWNRGLLLGCYCCRLPAGSTFDSWNALMIQNLQILQETKAYIWINSSPAMYGEVAKVLQDVIRFTRSLSKEVNRRIRH